MLIALLTFTLNPCNWTRI